LPTLDPRIIETDPRTDPRCAPYHRDDGWAEASTVHPEMDWPTGWICPGCGTNTDVFYGQGPTYNPETKRYAGPDDRLCRHCWDQAQGDTRE
jgi:rubredoxin